MKRFDVLLLACVLALPGLAGAQGTSLTGVWYGTPAVRVDSGLLVSVVLRLDSSATGWRAYLTLPESRQVDLELPSPYSDSAGISYANGRLRLEFTPDIGFGFLQNFGVPEDSQRIVLDVQRRGATLAGTLRITRLQVPITLTRRAPASALREFPVRFTNPNDHLQLGGKLVLPASAGPYPAAIFITGSDPDTRDRWRYEAGLLAERGVAALLYDKRGIGESVGASHDLASWDDLAGDVEGAFAYLVSRADVIDTARIGLIGQSQGTWLIAKVAARDPRVAFLVNISGSGISAAEQETYRTSALMERAGFPRQDIERAVAFQRQKFAVARTGYGWDALDTLMQQLRRDSVKWFPRYGTGAAIRSLALLRLYGVLQFNYDPTRDLEKIRVPTAVLMGERDVVFPPQVVVDKMKAAWQRAGSTEVAASIIPNASHGMLEVQTVQGRPFRWAISERFLRELTSWVTVHTRR